MKNAVSFWTIDRSHNMGSNFIFVFLASALLTVCCGAGGLTSGYKRCYHMRVARRCSSPLLCIYIEVSIAVSASVFARIARNGANSKSSDLNNYIRRRIYADMTMRGNGKFKHILHIFRKTRTRVPNIGNHPYKNHTPPHTS